MHSENDDFFTTDHSEPKTASTQNDSVPDLLTKENYPQHKDSLISNIMISVIAALVLSLLPSVILWTSITAYSKKDNSAPILSLLALGIIWLVAGTTIHEYCDALKTLRNDYWNLLPADELSAVQKRRRRNRAIAICVIGIVAAGLVAIPVIHSAKLSDAYNIAVSLADIGSYREAKEQFEAIEEKDYRDTTAYIYLCEAHIEYDDGNLSYACYYMNKANFCNLTAEQSKAVEDFAAVLNAEHDIYLKEKAEAAEAEAYRNRITHGVPFEGMPESEIRNTSLGAPSDNIRHNYECIGDKQYTANLYDFKCGDATIFTARCVRGVVTEVWDYRNDPVVSNKPKKSTKKKQSNDPYDVNDYYDAEDFYDDHYDDFFDFYDAEDYFYEHQD